MANNHDRKSGSGLWTYYVARSKNDEIQSDANALRRNSAPRPANNMRRVASSRLPDGIHALK